LSNLAGGDNGKVLTWDGTKWVAQAASATDNTKLPLTGGTMEGAIDMDSYNLANTGFIIMSPEKYIHMGNFTDAQEATLISGLTAGHEGVTWYNSTSKEIKYWPGAAPAIVLGGSSGATLLADSDNDTKIHIEKSPDEDKIRFD